MTDCQPSLLSWGDPSIAWIAEHIRTPWLSLMMVNISDLAHAGPIFIMIALGYWFWNKQFTKYIAYSVFFALLLNLWIKGIVMECRPPIEFWMEDVSSSTSFPSGHAQISIAVWAGFAYYLRNKGYAMLFLLTGILIALSRSYLGVHYVHDIVVGLLLGLSALGICILFEKRQLSPLKFLPLKAQALCILLGLSLYNFMVNNSSGSAIRGTGAFFGFWLGCQWARTIEFNRPPYLSMLLQSCIGLSVMFLLLTEINLKAYELPLLMLGVIKFIQSMVVGLWISFGAPLIFTKSMKGHALKKVAS